MAAKVGSARVSARVTFADVLWGFICVGFLGAQVGALWLLLRWLDGRRP